MKTSKLSMPMRLVIYVLGLFIMTIGIGASVKSNMGVSPVSSIPYTATCVWGLEMGKATILVHIIMVVLQILLLRKDFRWKNLLQVPVGVLFGYFTTFSNYLFTFLPDPANIGIQILLILVSSTLVAVGIFFYVPVDIIPLAGEGCMLAVSQKFGFKFANVKLAFDITMVVISLTVCLTMIHQLGSVGLGTIIAAISVGVELKLITKLWGKKRDKFLKITSVADGSNAEAREETLSRLMKRDVYTIEEDATILQALELITEKGVSGLPVTRQGKLTGFISDGDILRFLASEHPLYVNVSSLVAMDFDQKTRELVEMKVKALAARRTPITVDLHDDLGHVCYVLTENHIKKAPVMDDDEMVGVINISNITKYIVQSMAEQV